MRYIATVTEAEFLVVRGNEHHAVKFQGERFIVSINFSERVASELMDNQIILTEADKGDSEAPAATEEFQKLIDDIRNRFTPMD